MPSIRDQIEFLTHCGLKGCTLAPLERDASARTYMRIESHHRPMLFVVDRTSPLEISQFSRVQALIAEAGLSAPAIYEADPRNGFFLIEDFGPQVLDRVMRTSLGAEAFDVAVDALAKLRDIDPKGTLPAWQIEEMIDASFYEFFGYWWPTTFGAIHSIAQEDSLRATVLSLFQGIGDAPCSVFVHRDYFANNLIWLPERNGYRRIGIIDFQHASTGWAEYDIVSLAFDVRNPMPDESRVRILSRYLDRGGHRDGASQARISLCSFLRLLRIAGLWARLVHLEGREKYALYAPYTWQLLNQCLDVSLLKPIAEWFDDHVPRHLRRPSARVVLAG